MNEAKQELAYIEPSRAIQEVPRTTELVLDPDSMKNMMSLAEIMAKGVSTIPDHLKRNPSDCLAIVMQSMQWKMNPYSVAQKTHIVSGNLGYEAQLVNSVITAIAPTKDRLHFEWFGPWEKIIGKFKEVPNKTAGKAPYIVPNWNKADEAGLGVKCWATMKGESDPRELTLLLSQVRTRNSQLWADDPKQQIAYLVTKKWSRLYCPDVIMGVYTPDEFETHSIQTRIEPNSGPGEEFEYYDEDKFKKNFPVWKKSIESGKGTPAKVIAKLSTVALLTEDQLKAINELKPISKQDEEPAEEQDSSTEEGK